MSASRLTMNDLIDLNSKPRAKLQPTGTHIWTDADSGAVYAIDYTEDQLPGDRVHWHLVSWTQLRGPTPKILQGALDDECEKQNYHGESSDE